MSTKTERPGHLYDRAPDTVHLLRMLFPNPNLPDDLYGIAVRFHEHAVMAVGEVADGPELTVGLRKLLEAKDCFVRAALTSSETPRQRTTIHASPNCACGFNLAGTAFVDPLCEKFVDSNRHVPAPSSREEASGDL